jgi:hypothetical protein
MTLTHPHIAASRVCVLTTAAAFTDARAAFEEVRHHLSDTGASVEMVAGLDRTSANDAGVVETVATSDVVVLVDGAPLHARSVWRASALGDVLATSELVAIGAVGSVLGETMIDPRGGAPTTGLGYFRDVAVAQRAAPEVTRRTRDLLSDKVLLIELGPLSVVTFDGVWHHTAGDDLVVTRAGERVQF